LPSAINENKNEHFSIYPNPAENHITVSISSLFYTDVIINLYNLTGQILLKKEISSAKNTLSIANLPKGCYIVELTEKSGKSIREKLIIK
jgi:hypothetical protein